MALFLNFSFATCRSTIKFPYVLPKLIMTAVEIILRTNFCAVPAFKRVDPAKTSGPVSTSIANMASLEISEFGFQLTAIVRAPTVFAYFNPLIT